VNANKLGLPVEGSRCDKSNDHNQEHDLGKRK